MDALWDIGGAAVCALPAALRIAWDLRWHLAVQHHLSFSSPLLSKQETQPPAIEGGTEIGDASSDPLGVTLILCSHNDLAALQSIWSDWRGQQFPEHWPVEWLVVDDGSQDGTAEWLAALQSNDADLTVVHHPKSKPGKKGALAAGIRAAQHGHLVMTDADCRPQPHWARTMIESLTAPSHAPHLPEAGGACDIAIGVCLPDGGPSLLSFDALRVAFQYAGEAALGRPYMAVGRSIAYRKTAWQQVGGFQGHADLASGDDDLFVRDAVQSGLHIRLVHTSDASTAIHALPARDWKDGWHRKRRHLSTSGRYSRRARLQLGLDALLDPLIILAALTAPLGLLHKCIWIPTAAMVLAAAVRAITLSMFSQVWGKDAFPWWQCILWGPIRWVLLAIATARNAFTSSPTWTQRAPTSRS